MWLLEPREQPHQDRLPICYHLRTIKRLTERDGRTSVRQARSWRHTSRISFSDLNIAIGARYFFAAFAFAHRFRCASPIFFRAAADILRLGLGVSCITRWTAMAASLIAFRPFLTTACRNSGKCRTSESSSAFNSA
jgi:hypothetical protein